LNSRWGLDTRCWRVQRVQGARDLLFHWRHRSSALTLRCEYKTMYTCAYILV
jgi:hypothetical protein